VDKSVVYLIADIYNTDYHILRTFFVRKKVSIATEKKMGRWFVLITLCVLLVDGKTLDY